MSALIIASVGSWIDQKSFFPKKGEDIFGQLTIDPFVAQIVGEKSMLDVDLAPTPVKKLQWHGEYALPINTYLVVGEIVHLGIPAWHYDKPRRDDLEIIVDCGIPVRSLQVGPNYLFGKVRNFRRKHLEKGKWLAYLGSLTFSLTEIDCWGVWMRATARRILDLRVGSSTFSQLIEWDFEDPMPYDDTELPYSPNYYFFELLGHKRDK